MVAAAAWVAAVGQFEVLVWKLPRAPGAVRNGKAERKRPLPSLGPCRSCCPYPRPPSQTLVAKPPVGSGGPPWRSLPSGVEGSRRNAAGRGLRAELGPVPPLPLSLGLPGARGSGGLGLLVVRTRASGRGGPAHLGSSGQMLWPGCGGFFPTAGPGWGTLRGGVSSVPAWWAGCGRTAAAEVPVSPDPGHAVQTPSPSLLWSVSHPAGLGGARLPFGGAGG